MDEKNLKTESKTKVSLEKARILLGEEAKKFSDEQLGKILTSLREFCGMVYDVFKKVKRQKSFDGATKNIDDETTHEEDGSTYQDAA